MTRSHPKLVAIAATALIAVPAVATTAGTAAAAPTKTPLTAFQTADHFAMVAYTWKAKWYHHAHRTMGAREGSLGSATLDGILKKVVIGPDAMANTVSWTPHPGHEVSSRSLANGVTSIKVSFPVVVHAGNAPVTYHQTMVANVRRADGIWRVVGTSLPEAQGPTRYCVDSPAAAAHCNIYPPGSR